MALFADLPCEIPPADICVAPPTQGYMNKTKQLLAVNAVRNIMMGSASLKARAKMDLEKEKEKEKSGHSARGRELHLAADFTSAEINKMKSIDLINDDRKRMAELQQQVLRIQEETFSTCEKPTAAKPDKKTSRKRKQNNWFFLFLPNFFLEKSFNQALNVVIIPDMLT